MKAPSVKAFLLAAALASQFSFAHAQCLPWEMTKGFLCALPQGAANIANGTWKGGKEFCFSFVDAGGMTIDAAATACGRPIRYRPHGSLGQMLDGGASAGAYYCQVVPNLASFGVYGEVQAGIAWQRGQISDTEFCEVVGGAGVFQLGGAYLINRCAPASSAWKVPIRQAPRQVVVNAGRTIRTAATRLCNLNRSGCPTPAQIREVVTECSRTGGCEPLSAKAWQALNERWPGRFRILAREDLCVDSPTRGYHVYVFDPETGLIVDPTWSQFAPGTVEPPLFVGTLTQLIEQFSRCQNLLEPQYPSYPPPRTGPGYVENYYGDPACLPDVTACIRRGCQ